MQGSGKALQLFTIHPLPQLGYHHQKVSYLKCTMKLTCLVIFFGWSCSQWCMWSNENGNVNCGSDPTHCHSEIVQPKRGAPSTTLALWHAVSYATMSRHVMVTRDGLTNGPTGPRPRGPWAQGAPKPEPLREVAVMYGFNWVYLRCVKEMCMCAVNPVEVQVNLVIVLLKKPITF